MMIATKTVIVALLILAAIVCGGICLQIFLSKRESKLPGLILPAVSVIASLLTVANLAVTGMSAGEAVLTVLQVLLIGNLPTLVLAGIYIACRKKLQKNKNVEKMNIQDL